NYRRHLVPTALTAALLVTLIGLPGLLGQYGPSNFGHASPAGIAHWALLNGALLPFGLGLAVIPGAIFGLGLMLARPRTPLERAIAVLTIVATTLFLGQTALISASEAHRPLERYLFSLLAIGLSLAAGASVYATDRLATQWDARTFSTDPPDWLDRSGLGPARYLTLPRSNDFLGTQLESWNRDLRGVILLGKPAFDPYPV